MKQINMFEILHETYKITKPIRLKIIEVRTYKYATRYSLKTKDNKYIDCFSLNKKQKEVVSRLNYYFCVALGMKDHSYDEFIELLDMYLEKPNKYINSEKANRRKECLIDME